MVTGFHWTAWVTLAAIAMYAWVLYNVGKARGKFGIHAPVCDGPVEFLSVLRVQANTVEQMVVFFPALWVCTLCYNDVFPPSSAQSGWWHASCMHAVITPTRRNAAPVSCFHQLPLWH